MSNRLSENAGRIWLEKHDRPKKKQRKKQSRQSFFKSVEWKRVRYQALAYKQMSSMGLLLVKTLVPM